MRVKLKDSKEKQTTSLKNLNTRKSKIHHNGFTLKSELLNKYILILIQLIYRRLMILEDQLKQAYDELAEKKENIKQIRPTTAKMNKDNY